jgi:Protein of unknown function (DUF2971)
VLLNKKRYVKRRMTMDNGAFFSLFRELYDDIEGQDEFHLKQPFLAHYTSLDVLEKILKLDEIWLSNPLFMNDLEEVMFGINWGIGRFKESKTIRAALHSETRHKIFTDSLDHIKGNYVQEHLPDTYVFCFSEQAPENKDGLLSMWRGYGSNGHGAAILFDTSKLYPVEDSPLILAKVHYGRYDERLNWFDKTASKFADILTRSQIPDDKVAMASIGLFERLKLFALFTKHHGFKEENEWRVVYLSDRDTDKRLTSKRHYLNGPRGVEPKLRLKIAPMAGVIGPDLSLDKVIASILLGPSISGPLAVKSVERMLEVIGKPELKSRLFASSIPFRAI